MNERYERSNPGRAPWWCGLAFGGSMLAVLGAVGAIGHAVTRPAAGPDALARPHWCDEPGCPHCETNRAWQAEHPEHDLGHPDDDLGPGRVIALHRCDEPGCPRCEDRRAWEAVHSQAPAVGP